MNECSIIIFGATGDLTRRKLIPAVYRLVAEKKLSNFVVIGAAIDTLSANEILQRSKEFIDQYDEDVWRTVCNNFFYYQLSFEEYNDYTALRTKLEHHEKERNLQGNRLVYLATASYFFCPITRHLADSGVVQSLSKRSAHWHRIVYEKPFGYDLASAHEINTCIAEALQEHQIFRVDHYLTKELVSNIALVRFSNCVFEPLWNNRYVDQVQIILSETVGMEGRGGYYDKYGALSDVVQNHMLELLALIAMESPEKLVGDYIRERRAQVLKKIQVVDGILGQYDGYVQEPQVHEHSKTETAAMLYLMVNNPRWAGVPFYLKTGKRLKTKETVIYIKFKQVDCLLARNCPSESNWLIIRVEPDATISLYLNAKKPGVTDTVIPVTMEFSYASTFGVRTPEAYEVLLEEVIYGEQSIVVRFDEIEYAWNVIEKIRAQQYPLYRYKPGSQGPAEDVHFMKKHGMRWRS